MPAADSDACCFGAFGVMRLYAGEKLEQHFPLLHRNLRPDFHDSIRGKLKIAARVVGVLGKEDEQPVLPKWHARAHIRPDGTPRQEE